MIIIHVINNLEIGGAETQLVKLVSNDLNNKNIIFNLIGRNSFISVLPEISSAIYLKIYYLIFFMTQYLIFYHYFYMILL